MRNGIFGYLTENRLLCGQKIFDARFALRPSETRFRRSCLLLSLLTVAGLYIFAVVSDVSAVQHGIFGRSNVNERCFHSRKHILYLAQINISMNFTDVIGRVTDVMFDQGSSL